MFKSISEAEACRWLGRRVSLVGSDGVLTTTGRLQHVSSRRAFLVPDGRAIDPAGAVRSIPLAGIQLIVSADTEDRSL